MPTINFLDLFELGVKHNDRYAQWKLGQCYLQGIWVKRDENRAKELFKRAFDQGSALTLKVESGLSQLKLKRQRCISARAILVMRMVSIITHSVCIMESV